MRFVAASYALGEDVRKNDVRARKWYTRAAKAGDLTAKFDLAMMLLLGEGGPVDFRRGKRLLEEAATKGEPMAQKVLASVYDEGLYGFPVDRELAVHWKTVAESQGMQV